jgi:four helix bundle protein
MPASVHERIFDLEDRTFQFARNVRLFLKKLPRSIISEEDGRQLTRSSGSVGANYIEANETVGERDFLYRIKICRKEAKESRYWLNLLFIEEGRLLAKECMALSNEAEELMKIFGAIYRKRAAKSVTPDS